MTDPDAVAVIRVRHERLRAAIWKPSENAVPTYQEAIEAHADRATLLALFDRAGADLAMLVNKTEPEPHALHYDECPYKPFADLPSWETPDDAPNCTCSELHKGAYWKARWMLSNGWRQLAEKLAERAEVEVARLHASLDQTMNERDEAWARADALQDECNELAAENAQLLNRGHKS